MVKIITPLAIGETFFCDIRSIDFIINMCSCLAIPKACIHIYKIYIPLYISLKVVKNTKYKILQMQWKYFVGYVNWRLHKVTKK